MNRDRNGISGNPHLHVPGTQLADDFGGNWEDYLAKIETSSPRGSNTPIAWRR
jgi:hypothetical protein